MYDTCLVTQAFAFDFVIPVNVWITDDRHDSSVTHLVMGIPILCKYVHEACSSAYCVLYAQEGTNRYVCTYISTYVLIYAYTYTYVHI